MAVSGEGRGRVIDLFSVHGDEPIQVLADLLAQNGYQVRVFSDDDALAGAVQAARPDLLITDTTSLQGFGVCRRLKEDDHLWSIPVLALTRASDLADLFNLLDSGADSFLMLPPDPHLGLAIVGEMIGMAAEREIRDGQFRIRHENRVYRVAAGHRKVLELLVSAFESLVSSRSDLARRVAELEPLSGSVRFLEGRVADQARLVDTIQATLSLKEQKILALTAESGEMKALLARRTPRALIVEPGAEGGGAAPDAGDSAQPPSAVVGELNERILGLLAEIDALKMALESAQKDLDDERVHTTSLECTLELLGQERTQAENSLRLVSDEKMQLVAVVRAEREKNAAVDQKIGDVMQAKTESEAELSLMIGSLNDTKTRQDAEISRLKSVLEEEVARRVVTEQETEALRKRAEAAESSLTTAAAEAAAEISGLRGNLESARLALESEQKRTESLAGDLAAIVGEEKKLAMAEADLETERAAADALRREAREGATAREALRGEVDALGARLTAAIGERDRASRERDASDRQVTRLTEERRKIQAALETERRLHLTGNIQIESLKQAAQRMERELRSAAEERHRLKTLLEAERNLHPAIGDRSAERTNVQGTSAADGAGGDQGSPASPRRLPVLPAPAGEDVVAGIPRGDREGQTDRVAPAGPPPCPADVSAATLPPPVPDERNDRKRDQFHGILVIEEDLATGGEARLQETENPEYESPRPARGKGAVEKSPSSRPEMSPGAVTDIIDLFGNDDD